MNAGNSAPKQDRPSPSAIWAQVAYDKYLDSHPAYRPAQGDLLIYLTGRFPEDFTAIPLCIFNPDKGSDLVLLGAFNPETKQAQTGEVSWEITRHPKYGVFKPT